MKPRQEVVRNAEALKKIWFGELPAPLKEVDFSKEMILLVIQGQKKSGGFSIVIEKVLEKENEIQVFFREKSPGKDAIVTQVLTTPFHAVSIPRSEKKVIFVMQV